MYNKAKYLTGKIGGFIALALALTFFGAFLWVLGISAAEIKGGLRLLSAILNLIFVVALIVVFLICGYSTFKTPYLCKDNPSNPVWLFSSSKKKIVLVALSSIVLISDVLGLWVTNIFAVIESNFKVELFNTLSGAQGILQWLQIGLTLCVIVLDTLSLVMSATAKAKPVEKTIEE